MTRRSALAVLLAIASTALVGSKAAAAPPDSMTADSVRTAGLSQVEPLAQMEPTTYELTTTAVDSARLGGDYTSYTLTSERPPAVGDIAYFLGALHVYDGTGWVETPRAYMRTRQPAQLGTRSLLNRLRHR